MRFGGLALAALLLAACSKPKGSRATPAPAASHAEAAVTASAPAITSVAASAGNAATSPFAHTPIDPSSIKPPPLVPPPEAKAGEGGVHFQLLEPGAGDLAGPNDAITVDFSMWTGDGKLSHSSYADPQSTLFSIATVSPQLRGMLAPLKKGAKARYWLPKASLAGWRPKDWPDADLIVEVEVHNLSHVTYTDLTGKIVNPVPFQAPDAAGPPSNALSTPSGLRYIYLTHGSGKQHPKPGQHLDLRLDAYAVDGLTVEPLEKGLTTATTLERAPGNLSEVLKQLQDGDQVRVWLPMGVGRQVIPKAGSHDVLLDMTVTLGD